MFYWRDPISGRRIENLGQQESCDQNIEFVIIVRTQKNISAGHHDAQRQSNSLMLHWCIKPTLPECLNPIEFAWCLDANLEVTRQGIHASWRPREWCINATCCLKELYWFPSISFHMTGESADLFCHAIWMHHYKFSWFSLYTWFDGNNY